MHCGGTIQAPRLDIQNMDGASLLHGEQILQGGTVEKNRKTFYLITLKFMMKFPRHDLRSHAGTYFNLKKRKNHCAILSPGVLSSRSINGVDQEDKGTDARKVALALGKA